MSDGDGKTSGGMTVDSVPERRITRPGGVEIAYWVHGEGTPLVLITGLGTPAVSWGPFPGILAGLGYQAIVVDNRDCGNSSPCDGIDYKVEDMADDAVAVLDDLGIDRAYVLGISMGGMIAQAIGLNHPDRVIKLMLLATTPGQPAHVPADPAFIADVFVMPPDEDQKAWTIRTLGKIMGPGFAERNRELMETAAEIRIKHGSDPQEFTRQWNAIMQFGVYDRLTEMKPPTLVLHGDADPLVPYPNGQKIAARIPGAELVTLPGVGHFVPAEAPAETVAAITRFFPVEVPAQAR